MRFFFIPTLLVLNITGYAQSFDGKIIDSMSGEGLEYATIGVVGKSIGGISDRNGNFSVDLRAAGRNDLVRISYIGYSSFEVRLDSVDFSKNYTIPLSGNVRELKPVEVPVTAVVKVFGNQKTGRTYTGWGDFQSKKGRARGLLIEGLECPARVKSFSFRINHNDWDSVRFRLNIAEVRDDVPGATVLTENIFITTSLKHQWIKVDLRPHHVIVCSRTIVSLEWVDAWGKTGEQSNLLTLSLGKSNGLMLVKEPGEEYGSMQAMEHAPAMFVEIYSD